MGKTGANGDNVAWPSPFSALSTQRNPSDSGYGFGFGSFSSPDEKPLPPPPEEVLVSDSEEDSWTATFNVEPVVICDLLTLYKGRVSTSEVFGVGNSDLLPGKYEGGLKLWEGSLDLVRTLYSELQERHLSLRGKRVLELGCGHGLPGIFTLTEGAADVHFQDFNAEVLKCLTIRNVKENLRRVSPSENHMRTRGGPSAPRFRFFAGDWCEIHKLLLSENDGEESKNSSSENQTPKLYDIILMAETVYSVPSLQNLYTLIKRFLRCPGGVVYMAGKKHYFGVGGGTRQFVNLVKEDGIMGSSLLAELTDGSSNVREVWKFVLD